MIAITGWATSTTFWLVLTGMRARDLQYEALENGWSEIARSIAVTAFCAVAGALSLIFLVKAVVAAAGGNCV